MKLQTTYISGNRVTGDWLLVTFPFTFQYRLIDPFIAQYVDPGKQKSILDHKQARAGPVGHRDVSRCALACIIKRRPRIEKNNIILYGIFNHDFKI